MPKVSIPYCVLKILSRVDLMYSGRGGGGVGTGGGRRKEGGRRRRANETLRFEGLRGKTPDLQGGL